MTLKSGTSDSRKDWFAAGDYKKLPNEVGGMDTALEDAVDELKRVEELENARKEMEKINGEGTVSQKMFRAI